MIAYLTYLSDLIFMSDRAREVIYGEVHRGVAKEKATGQLPL